VLRAFPKNGFTCHNIIYLAGKNRNFEHEIMSYRRPIPNVGELRLTAWKINQADEKDLQVVNYFGTFFVKNT
jgi:hypothetical protein